ncbi:DUF1109 domain-containing protein [Pseudotabrizicola sp. 4114]|uniref:DUF1109 domain-containing protein n=1 Tax=Pseudotabrizicola sp. 4114 TaxID=2817731 RepID=UPI002855569F|nr:hypothetical protein [Pseudorhodobacter sp. 4114]
MTNRQSTRDLIRDLAAAPAPVPFNPVATAGGMLTLLVIGLVPFLAVSGLRPDLAAAWEQLPVQAKTVLPVLLSISAIWLALRSSRPEARLALWPLAVPAAPAIALVLWRLAGAEGSLLSETMGQTALVCLGSITLLSALPLAAGVCLLRRAAPTRPVLTGTLLGIAAAAGVTAGYALHCTEDSPLFFVTWYGLAIGIVGMTGAWLGHQFLRW